MKRLFLTIFVTLFTVALYAQTESNHLTFKGIPIDGDYKVFAQKLVQKGFVQTGTSDDGILLKGTFMAHPNVSVGVYPNPSTKTVAGVSAIIEVGDNWSTIEDQYYDIVDLYSEKYGNCTSHIEEFTTTVYGNSSKLSCIRNGECNYSSTWELDAGMIIIAIDYFDHKYCVICNYYDEINYNTYRQSMLDDI